MDTRLKSLFVNEFQDHIWQTDVYDFIVSKETLIELFGKEYVILTITFDPVERTVIYVVEKM